MTPHETPKQLGQRIAARGGHASAERALDDLVHPACSLATLRVRVVDLLKDDTVTAGAVEDLVVHVRGRCPAGLIFSSREVPLVYVGAYVPGGGPAVGAAASVLKHQARPAPEFVERVTPPARSRSGRAVARSGAKRTPLYVTQSWHLCSEPRPERSGFWGATWNQGSVRSVAGGLPGLGKRR
jgi:hypothetical protein